MGIDDLITDIKSFKSRLSNRRNDAVKAIGDDEWLVAQNAINDCIGYEAVIDELMFQIDRIEVEQA